MEVREKINKVRYTCIANIFRLFVLYGEYTACSFGN